MEMYAVIPTGETILLNTQALTGKLDTTRVLGLMIKALAVGSEAERRVRIEALWKLFAQNSSSLHSILSGSPFNNSGATRGNPSQP